MQKRVLFIHRDTASIWPKLFNYHCDLIIQNIFTEIKHPKHPLHYLILSVKVSHAVQWFFRPTYPYQLPLSKTSRYTRGFVPVLRSFRVLN